MVIVMICSNCHEQNEDNFRFCRRCGMPLQPPAGEQLSSASRPPQPATMVTPPPVFTPYAAFPQKKFSWGDVATIVGFISSILGLFYFGVVLCPVGLITSIFGFCQNRTRKLAVAGLVISILGLLIMLGNALYTNDLLPEWLAQGAFMWFR